MKCIKFLFSLLIALILIGNCEKKPIAPDDLYNKNLDNHPNKNLVCVPAGAFTMGSNLGGLDEQPVHNVYLDAYYIDKYEVTNSQYVAFLNEALATGEIQANSSTVTKDDHELLDLNDPYCQISFNGNRFSVKDDNAFYPVIEVSWYGADAYAKHYGKRLPTEAEWEKAARGTEGRSYPWGNNGPDSSNCNCKDNIGHTTPVGQYSPIGDSPYGCCDMIGNVWEWCNDWYDKDYYKECHQQGTVTDPPGPKSGRYRVLRGGAFYNVGDAFRCSSRYSGLRFYKFDIVGFRVVR